MSLRKPVHPTYPGSGRFVLLGDTVKYTSAVTRRRRLGIVQAVHADDVLVTSPDRSVSDHRSWVSADTLEFVKAHHKSVLR